MSEQEAVLRGHARAIWDAAVAAVDPFELVRRALADPASELGAAARRARQVLVVGGGKAGAAMAAGVEAALADRLDHVGGLVNVPEGGERPLQRIRLNAARPAGSNQPTTAGVEGAYEMLRLLARAGPDDLALCLLSGGGSALLPAPDGSTLEEKQQVTQLLHASGATIDEMNCVRKHLSFLKGGRLAQASRAGALVSLILSDVVGDPLDVIASGPTAPDPTTYSDALAVLDRYGLRDRVPRNVCDTLEYGAGQYGGGQRSRPPDTPKELPPGTRNIVLGNNAGALAAARAQAAALGYGVVDLGAFIEGETREVAKVLAGVVRSIRADGRPLAPPACVLLGGETTVTLPSDHGRGGRNQEFVLAALLKLGRAGLPGVVVLSGGTDGEDGPTDAAGAVAGASTLERAAAAGLNAADFLARHDAYSFFQATGDLLRTGLTGTNVMDVRVLLVGV
jgi:hydroxypyruvate reductase/glycerate 2-kinase